MSRGWTSADGPEPIDPRGAGLASRLGELTAHLAASAAELDREATFPHRNLAHLHRLGLPGLTVPSELGGHDADLPTVRRVVEAVARGEPSTALILAMHCLQHRALHRDGRWPEALRERVGRQAVEAGGLINALRVEPDLGSPARGGLPATVARRTAGGWRLSGTKLYSTGSPGLAWMNVWARSDDDPALVGFWLVPADAPGVSIHEEWDHLGLRASGSHRVTFDDVELPLDHAVDIGPADRDAGPGDDKSRWMNVLLGTLYDGIAQAARDWFRDWLRQRAPSNLGAPLASLPRFQETLGRIDTLLLANALLLDAAAHGRVESARLPQIKQLVTSQAIRAVELAVEAGGNPALSRANPLERHYRDVLCGRIHTPQDDAIFLAAGKAALASQGESP